MSSFPDALKALRARKGWSQAELAQKVGKTRSAVGMWELGERQPSYEDLELIADTFNVDMNTLLGWDGYEFDPQFDMGPLLRERRIRQGIDVSDLSAHMGVTRKQWTEIEDGALPLTDEMAEKAAVYMNTSVVQLRAEAEQKEKAPAEAGAGELDVDIAVLIRDFPVEVKKQLLDYVKFLKTQQGEDTNG